MEINSLQNDLNKISIDHKEIIKSDEGLIRWLEFLHQYGISIVKNAPTEKNSAFPVLHRISHTRETFFKTPFEVINITKRPNNSAYTAKGLRKSFRFTLLRNSTRISIFTLFN